MFTVLNTITGSNAIYFKQISSVYCVWMQILTYLCLDLVLSVNLIISYDIIDVSKILCMVITTLCGNQLEK